jgi:hypothetical protein
MDAERFDRFTRILSSRRIALGGLAGIASAALSGWVTPEAAGAHNALPACRRIKNKNRRNACLRRARQHNALHKVKVPPASPPVCQGRNVCAQGNAAACGAPGNECYCWVTPAGASVCGGNDGAFVVDDCGDCEETGRICVLGDGLNCPGPLICVLPCCPAGFRECNGVCVDVLRDSNNCGACGRSCGIDRPNICAGGSCCIDGAGNTPCLCAPQGSACAPVGGACCSGGATCTNGVCP